MKTLSHLSHVRALLYRQPWMITPSGLDVVCSVVENHLRSIDDPEYKSRIDRLEKEAVEERLLRDKNFFKQINSLVSEAMFTEQGKELYSRIVTDAWGNEYDKKFYSVQDGVGILRLTGPIMPRANLMTRMSGATALENWSQDFTEMMEDDDVNSAILLVDSPGGSVSLGYETASQVFAARQQPKPVVTLVEGTCASLAYLIGSQSDAIYTTEASMTGSIGVVMAIEDDTRQSENEGIKRTVLKTGKNKAIGIGPVTDDQIAELKSMMGDYFDRFKSAVVRARAGIDIEKVSDGSLWIGQKSVDAGLTDGITTLSALVKQLSE